MRKQYVKHRIENLVNIAKIVTIHYYELDKNFSYPGESHDFWELVYADKNDIRALRGDEWITLREGELLFHKPMEYHTIASDGKKAPNVLILSFECRSPAMSFFEGKRMRVPDGLRHHLAAVITEATVGGAQGGAEMPEMGQNSDSEQNPFMPGPPGNNKKKNK